MSREYRLLQVRFHTQKIFEYSFANQTGLNSHTYLIIFLKYYLYMIHVFLFLFLLLLLSCTALYQINECISTKTVLILTFPADIACFMLKSKAII